MGLDPDDVRGKIVTPREEPPKVRMRPHIQVLLESSYHIAFMELNRLREKAIKGPLTYEELRAYRTLTQTTTELAKEERAQDASKDPGADDDEKLLLKGQQALKVLKGENDEVFAVPEEES